MLDKNDRPINLYQPPSTINRLGAALLDLAFFIILSIIILTLGGLVAGNKGTPFHQANTTISEHIIYSKLAKDDNKNGYVAYRGNELLTIEEDGHSLIIKNVAYFYCSYLTGEGVETSLLPSLDKDQTIKIKDLEVLPKDYYTISFFNEEILGLPKPGVIGESPYFVYEQGSEGNDYTKIGTFKEELSESVIVDGKTVKRLKNDVDFNNKISQIYNDAIKDFYNQKSIKKANSVLNVTNTVLMLVATLPSLAIFYILIPLLSKFGQTLGKRFLSIAVVDYQGYLVKKWRMLLRVVPLLGVVIYICLVNSLYFQLLISLLTLLLSSGILVFSPRRKALHDLVAGTVAIKLEKGTIIYPDEERYTQALNIMKERDEASHE